MWVLRESVLNSRSSCKCELSMHQGVQVLTFHASLGIYFTQFSRHILLASARSSILFVDDDDELREIVRTQLEDEGYEVDEAVDGLMAMQKLQQRPYDLVLLDITMPLKSGMDVLSFVKERSMKCHVIMLTGVVGLSMAIDSLSLGADDYITKPYNMDYLLSSIKRVLNG